MKKKGNNNPQGERRTVCLGRQITNSELWMFIHPFAAAMGFELLQLFPGWGFELAQMFSLTAQLMYITNDSSLICYESKLTQTYKISDPSCIQMPFSLPKMCHSTASVEVCSLFRLFLFSECLLVLSLV